MIFAVVSVRCGSGKTRPTVSAGGAGEGAISAAGSSSAQSIATDWREAIADESCEVGELATASPLRTGVARELSGVSNLRRSEG